MPTEFVSTSESLAALKRVTASALGLLEPPPELSVSEWADRFAVLPRESSAQPGQWITATAEYQRGFMDAASDPAIERIVGMWPAQTGKSASLLNVHGYYVHHDPSSQLMVQPTLETAENFSKDRIAPMIRDTPKLKPLFGDPRTRDSGNTLLHKQFPGGFMALAGANSPAGLASRPIRVVSLDEVDKYEASAGSEGDPVKLAEARTTTFWNRKIILTSTPSIKGASRIEREFLKSDQRKYFVTCPHCGEEQTLEWGNLRWPSPNSDKTLTEHRPEDCYYVCGISGCEIVESDKPDMIRNGRWRATAKSIDGRTAGFHLNALYSPWVSWPDMIRKWLDAQGSPEELQTFVNASLAETWEVKGDRVEQSIFEDRTHAYAAQAPAGVLVVTAGVDVQRDRIEATSVGWGAGEESWALEHRVFEGDPSRPAVWSELDEWLRTEYEHESGIRLRIRCAMVDSGDQTKEVYAFTRPRRARKIYACKGRAGAYPILERPKKSGDSGTLLYMVGVDAAKESFYARLKIEQEGPGYCHFRDDAAMFDKEFFMQISAEQMVRVKRSGGYVKVWQKRRDRNEALDTRVYAMAALERIRADFPALKRSLRRTITEAERQHMGGDENADKQARTAEYLNRYAEIQENESRRVAEYEAEQERLREKTAAEEARQARDARRALARAMPKRRGGWPGRW